MSEKNTKELEKILGSTHLNEFNEFREANVDSMLDEKDFSEYFKELFKVKGILQQTVFLKADIPERYGYKLLSEEKRTKQRDYILRICYAANMTLEETQTALTLYGMAQLYARIPRDAVLMIALNQKKSDVLAVNALLEEHGMEPLRGSGNME